MRYALAYARDVLLELLWPTRCAVCDRPGDDVVCKECQDRLKVVDALLACPKCGAPFGIVQCSECNKLMLKSSGLEELPFDTMSNALILDNAARKIISAYKDQNERRLCTFIASAIHGQICPNLFRDRYVVTYVPDSKRAFRKRGFDHSLEIATEVSRMSNMPCMQLFKRPTTTDQRRLKRSSRIDNMRQSLKIMPEIELPSKVLLIDDVCTTGATVYAACLEMRENGIEKIAVATFSRVIA